MKFTITTILGLIIFICVIAITLLDMQYSLNPDYHFVLEFWHVIIGVILSVSLIIMPEEKLISLISALVKKYTGK